MEKTAAVHSEMRQKIAHAAAEAKVPLSRDEVEGIVSNVIASLSGDLTASDLKLYQELRALALFIQNAKKEIAAIRPEDISSSHIPSATDELDAVVGATEEATHRIMDACDAIMNEAASLPDEAQRDKIINPINNIFEACSFQDITGQRITKVVKTLKRIEEQVHALLRAFGENMEERLAVAGPAEDQREGEKRLLNGPQLSGQGRTQEEIDKLLQGF